ncbi:MAG: ABC transporter permease [Acidimicrobiia bacterium]
MNDGLFVTLVVAGVSFGTPLALAALGELISQRSGVLNIGVEGTMLIGAIFAFWATSATESLLVGFLAGIAAGALVGVIFAIAAVGFKANQMVLGFALFLTGLGLSSYIATAASLTGTRAPSHLGPLISGGITDWPFFGPVLFGQDLLVYVSWILVAAASIYLHRTRPGLALRAVGDDPAAADSLGIRVNRVRVAHVAVGSAAAGLAGAYISLGLIPAWSDNITGGGGWVALSLVILSGWRPWRVLLAAYIFGAATRLAFTFQVRGIGIPPELLDMLPYVLAFALLIATSVGSGRVGAEPTALTKPYSREGS